MSSDPNRLGPISAFFARTGDLMLLNLLFIAGCLPVVTAGASAAALHYVTLRMHRKQDVNVVRDFFRSWKQNLKQGFILELITLVVAAVLIVDIYVLIRMSGQDGFFRVLMFLWAVVALRLLAIWVYLFPLLAQFDHGISTFINSARIMSRRHLSHTAAIMLILAFPIALGAIVPYALELELFFFIFAGFSVMARVAARFYAQVFDLYITDAGAACGPEACGPTEEAR